jgi:hypothetical protein
LTVEAPAKQSFGLWAALWILALLCAFGGLIGAWHVLGQFWVFDDWYVPWLLPVLFVPLLVLPLTVGRPGQTQLVFAVLACLAVVLIGLAGAALLVWGHGGGWQPELCCEASGENLPWRLGGMISLAYALAGAMMLALLVGARRRDRAISRRARVRSSGAAA